VILFSKYPQLINYLFFVYISCKLRIFFFPLRDRGRGCGGFIVNFLLFVFNFNSHCNENFYIGRPPKCEVFFLLGWVNQMVHFGKKT